MKKRMVNKWINRYLTPLIKDLPIIDWFDHEKYDNFTLINGEKVPEGNMYPVEHNPLKAVRKQESELKYILSFYDGKKIFIRRKPTALIHDNNEWHIDVPRKKHPRLRFYGIAMRLLIEK